MEYFAETKKLTKILNNERLLIKHFGKNKAKKIIDRLDEFSAASNLSEIPSDPPPRCHPLTGNLNNKFAVDVSGNYRMIFEGYDKNDKLSIKKSEIVTIQIIAIDDHH
jgi:proteic killer suppression protein